MIGRCQLECRAAKEAMNHLVIGTAQIQPQMSDDQTSSPVVCTVSTPLLLRLLLGSPIQISTQMSGRGSKQLVS